MISGRAKVCLFLLYITAWVTGILAVTLPFWVSTGVDDGVREVQLNKKIDSGLWWKYERFEVKHGSIPEADSWWTRITDTSLHTKSVIHVTGLVTTGMAILTVSFICAVCVVCCSCCAKEDDRKIQLILIAVTLFLAAGFIAIGTIVFFKQVLDDYKIGENEEHLGVSFWLAVTSSVSAFLTGVFVSYHACCIGQDKLK